MKNILISSTCFLFFAYYGVTSGKCMMLDEELELSKRHSLISGFDFTKDGKKAAITLGISQPTVSKSIPHAYLAFEISQGDKISLIGVDMRANEGVTYLPSPANTNLRSHKEVIKDFVGINGKRPKISKIKSFIVPKRNAEEALKSAEAYNGGFVARGKFITNMGVDANSKNYNCCTYAIYILKEAGINLGGSLNIITTDNTLRTMVEKYQNPYEISVLQPLKSSTLIWEAKGKEQVHTTAQHAFEQNPCDPYALGVTSCNYKDYKQAFNYFTDAFWQGDPRAQYACGWMYSQGYGIEQSDDKAFNCYVQAAYNGNAAAQYALGWMYHNGRGVYQDNELAFRWYELAANNGNTDAQYALGMGSNNQLVSQNNGTAFSHYAYSRQ